MKLNLSKSRIVIIEFGRKKKFVLPGQINRENIQAFVNKYLGGKAQSYELNIQDEYIEK